MNRFRYPTVVALGVWIAFAPAGSDAQELARGVHDSSDARRPILLPLPEVPHASQQRPLRLTPSRVADSTSAGISGVPGAQSTRNARSERGLARKVLGALAGAAGGLFAGGYLGATIEGDRCHCDDPGLQGALIGAPIGMVAGGILGFRYLF